MSEYPLDEWVNWRWEIKWSKYEPDHPERHTGLYRTTDASLTVYINKARRVQWSGKLGRNDEGRIPYFKVGIYNPNGQSTRIAFKISNGWLMMILCHHAVSKCT